MKQQNFGEFETTESTHTKIREYISQSDADEWDIKSDGQYLGYVHDNGNKLLIFKVEPIQI
jgi:hypothetical protein